MRSDTSADTSAVMALATLLLLTAASAQDGLNIVATTPPQDSNGGYFTWIEPLATALLGEGTPGLFWGTVSPYDVNSACDWIVQTGSYSVPATITGYGNTFSTTLTVSAIGGCGAGDNAPVGVQAVWTDDSGREAAIICTDDFTWSLGCSVYLTGEDVNSFHSQLGGRRKLLSLGGETISVTTHPHTRKMLQSCPDTYPSCSSWGSGLCGSAGVADFCPCMCGRVTPPPPPPENSQPSGPSDSDKINCGAGTAGAVAGGVGIAIGCTAALVFAPLCYAAAAAGAVGASVGACSGAIGNSCFPGHATVQLADGRVVSMGHLSLGDKVAVFQKDGRVGYQTVYLFGHRDEHVVATFVRLGLAEDASKPESVALELTNRHFMLTAGPKGAVQHKRAADVELGDIVWVMGLDHPSTSRTLPVQQELQKYTVVSVTNTTAVGLFNPYTMGGTIIVNGVAASAHSEWFADAVFDSMGISIAWLPSLYQWVLAPVRFLWTAMGPDAFIELYNKLDAELEFASVSSPLSLVYALARAFHAAALDVIMGYGLGTASTAIAASVAFVGLSYATACKYRGPVSSTM